MSLQQINKKAPPVKSFALFELGFRPFFMGAAIFAVSTILLWMLVFVFNFSITTAPLSLPQWHSHEMIYGYSMAVVAGFLLTAIMNWTGIQTINRLRLGLLFTLWALARVLLLPGSAYLSVAALLDICFMAALIAASAAPIVKARQWQQLIILIVLALLLLGNCCFYLGAHGLLLHGVSWGIYGGLYLITGLILIIGGRVLPPFIINGVDGNVNISNPRWLATSSLVLLLLFTANQLFIGNQLFLFTAATALFLLTSRRLMLWHTPGIWSKPLLWSLFLSFVFIDIGFLLYALSAFALVSPSLAAHALGYGGIGLITVSMMARVTLGHTGRNIRSPSKTTAIALMLLTLGAVIRIGAPLLAPSLYLTWIAVSQILWLATFALFLLAYTLMLTGPRIDGQPG